MVALLGLLDAGEVRVEVLLPRPRGPVDALEHLVARVAAPVGAGELGQLEHLEAAGRRDVRAAAQVDEGALAVERDVLVRRDRRDDLGLVVLAHALEELHGLVARHQRAHDRLVLPRELDHPLLDRGEVLGRERALVAEVVVEAVLDHRADRDLGLGEELLHRVGEQVGGRVANHLEPLRIAIGDDGDRSVAVDAVRGVDELAVDLAGQRGLGEAGADRRGDLGDGDRRVVVADGAVWQSDVGHGGFPGRGRKKTRTSRVSAVLRRRRACRNAVSSAVYLENERVRGVITGSLSCRPPGPSRALAEVVPRGDRNGILPRIGRPGAQTRPSGTGRRSRARASRGRGGARRRLRSRAFDGGPNGAPNGRGRGRESGRRDWTRTNDPHHVKVVL